MARPASLRASDLDREQVADRLRRATTEGRLDTDELEARLAVAYGARTYGELDELIADLPSVSLVTHARRLPAWTVPAGTVAGLVALLSLIAGRVALDDRHEHPRDLPFGAAHHALVLAAPMAGLLCLAVLCAALGWLAVRARGPHGA